LGLTARWLVCLFGGQNKDASKKEIDKGVLALDGQNFEEKHNNQRVIGGRGGRHVEEEARPVWSAGGDAITSICAEIRRTKKNQIIIHPGLRRPPINCFTPNN
jgi:hypothetical protein